MTVWIPNSKILALIIFQRKIRIIGSIIDRTRQLGLELIECAS